MAISADFHEDLPGGLTLSQAGLYWHLSGVQHDVLEETATIVFAAWLNAERREAYKAWSAPLRVARTAVTQEEAAYAEHPTVHRERAVVIARAGLAAGVEERNKSAPTELRMQFALTGADYAAVLTEDGDVSRAKVYEWAMLRFENAEAV